MLCKTLPLVPMTPDPVREEFDYVKRDAPTDSYHSLGLPMGWMSLCNPDYSKYSLTERKGFLRLRPSTIDLSETANPTFVARRQTELNFSATALFDLSHLTEGMQAGITAYAAPLNHYDVVVERRNGKLFVKSVVRLGQTSHSEKELPLSGYRAYLRITSDKDFYYMQASSDGTNFTTLAKMEYRFLSTETIGGFTGVMLGLFTQCKGLTDGYVDIDWFENLLFAYQKGSGEPYTDLTFTEPSSKQSAPATMDAWLWREYQYLVAPQYSVGGSIGYAFIFPQTKMKTHVRLSASHRKANQTFEYSNGKDCTSLALAVGCTF